MRDISGYCDNGTAKIFFPCCSQSDRVVDLGVLFVIAIVDVDKSPGVVVVVSDGDNIVVISIIEEVVIVEEVVLVLVTLSKRVVV